jgi:hypothetical protein
MRRIDEAARLSDMLPPATVLGVDFEVLGRRLVDLPDEVNGVLRLIDGRRTLREVIGVSPLDDLSTLTIAQRLLADGIVRREQQPGEEAAKKPSRGSGWAPIRFCRRRSRADPLPLQCPPGFPSPSRKWWRSSLRVLRLPTFASRVTGPSAGCAASACASRTRPPGPRSRRAVRCG